MTNLSVTRLVPGLSFPEAPRWSGGRLWFTDMIGKRVCSTDLDGIVETVANFEEMPGGIGFLSSGTLLVVGMTSACLYAIHDGRAEVYADLHQMAGGHLDDMVVASKDIAYVGAVGTMTAQAEGAPPGGGIVSVTSGGAVSLQATDMAFPNGVVVAGDERILLVNETFAERITAFDIDAAVGLSNRRIWAELPGLHPDGLAIDDEGAAWVGCYLEEKCVRVLEGGKITDTIETTGRWATGIELGGPDGRTLFICTADTDQTRFFRGVSHGSIDTVRVDVPAIWIAA